MIDLINGKKSPMPGTIVLLKSGGLPMQITGDGPIEDFEKISCLWMAPDGSIHRETFHANELKLAAEDPAYIREREMQDMKNQINEIALKLQLKQAQAKAANISLSKT
jgi:uncharacterized protein YodC (DUF2158 family)